MEVPEFVAEVPDDLVCLICMHAVGVNGTAVVTVGCGHLFCQGCIQQWLDTSGNTTCPADRQPLTKTDLRPDVRSQRRADALLVKCGSTTRGAPTEAELAEGRPAEPCTWQGAWSDLAAHEKRCPHSAPRVHCPLRVLGCTGPGSSFGMTSEVANVATRSALHFAEASEHHLRVISSAILADRARTDALQAQLEAMSRSVAQLRAAAEDAETRAMAAERRVEEALVTIVNGDMRLLHDELTVLKMSSVDNARLETTDPGEDASPPDAFTFSDLMLNPASSSQQPPSYVSRAAQQLFSLGTDGTARPLKPGWSILLGGPRGRYARHGSFEFRLCIEDLRSENDPSRADAVAAASGVMIGVTTNRGAALHHGRRGHFGFVPGSCGLQGSGFVWCGGASSLATLPDGSRITFGYGDVVTVRVGASSDNTAFTTISFGVRGEWTPPVPIGMLGRGPVFPAAALLGMEAGLRWR